MLAGIGFVAVFAGAANTPLATIVMAVELFGADIAPFAAIACIASYLVSGHTGIYLAQRISHSKHNRAYSKEMRLSDVKLAKSGRLEVSKSTADVEPHDEV